MKIKIGGKAYYYSSGEMDNDKAVALNPFNNREYDINIASYAFKLGFALWGGTLANDELVRVVKAMKIIDNVGIGPASTIYDHNTYWRYAHHREHLWDNVDSFTHKIRNYDYPTHPFSIRA